MTDNDDEDETVDVRLEREGERVMLKITPDMVIEQVVAQVIGARGEGALLYVLAEVVNRAVKKLITKSGGEMYVPEDQHAQYEELAESVAQFLYDAEQKARKDLIERLGGTLTDEPAIKSAATPAATSKDFDLAGFTPKGKGN